MSQTMAGQLNEVHFQSPGKVGFHNGNKIHPTVNTKTKTKTWIPYEHSWTETPFLCCLAGCLRYWIKFRNLLLKNPLFSWRIPSPYKPHSRIFTLGEAVLTLLLFGGTIAFCVIVVVQGTASIEGTGVIAVLPTILTFTLATRNSIYTLLLGIPFERQLYWHKLMAFVAIMFSWAHGIRAFQGEPAEPGDEDGGHNHTEDFVSGLGFAVAMTAMVLFSLPLVRRYIFNLFYYMHIILAIAAIVFGIMHEAGGILIGVGIWGIDVLFRFFYLSLLKHPTKCTASRLPSNVIRLMFPKGHRDYSPGQYLFVLVPGVNPFEWHPFSISSSPHHDKISIHIRVLGNWTKNLYDLVSKNNGSPLELTAFFEGPYGAPEIDIDGSKYEMFLLVSGGIGITPMQSICNHLVHEAEDKGRPMKKIWFVWSCADKYMVSATYEHDREWTIENKHSESAHRLPLSFQPDSLQKVGTSKWLENLDELGSDNTVPDELLHTEFYLTRARKQEDFSEANIAPELQPHLRFGRPVLPKIFDKMRFYAKTMQEKRVAVMTCGPVKMIDDVRVLCSSQSKEGVRFDFHGEVFEF